MILTIRLRPMDMPDNLAKASIKSSSVVVVTVSSAVSSTSAEPPAQGFRHLSFACVGSAADEDD